jgi:hypothetical protein
LIVSEVCISLAYAIPQENNSSQREGKKRVGIGCPVGSCEFDTTLCCGEFPCQTRVCAGQVAGHKKSEQFFEIERRLVQSPEEVSTLWGGTHKPDDQTWGLCGFRLRQPLPRQSRESFRTSLVEWIPRLLLL